MGRNRKSAVIAQNARCLYSNTAMSMNEIADRFNISPTTVNNMILKLGAYKNIEVRHYGSTKDRRIIR